MITEKLERLLYVVRTMGKMKQIKVVSIDMFRTLVDLESVEHVIWQMLLKDTYTVELVEECAAHAGNSLFEYLPQDKFLSVKSIFTISFAEMFSSIDREFDAAEAAKLWAQQHSLSKPFDDSLLFLDSVGKECLDNKNRLDITFVEISSPYYIPKVQYRLCFTDSEHFCATAWT